MKTVKVVDIEGKEVNTDKEPDGLLLDLARTFLDDVMKGKIKSGVIVTFDQDGMFTCGFAGNYTEIITLLSRASYRVNRELDETNDDEEEDPA